MDELVKAFSNLSEQLKRAKVKVKSFGSNVDGAINSGFRKSHLVRPVLSKDEDSARQMAFLKRSVDGTSYIAGPGFQPLESQFLLELKLRSMLKNVFDGKKF